MGLPLFLSSLAFTTGRRPARNTGSRVLATYQRGDLQVVELLEGDAGVTVQVNGEMDFGHADLLPAAVAHAADASAPGPPVVHLDLTRLTFCDCAGLRAIEQAHAYLLQRGGRLTLSDVQPIVRRLVRVAGLEDQLLGSERPSDRTLRGRSA